MNMKLIIAAVVAFFGVSGAGGGYVYTVIEGYKAKLHEMAQLVEKATQPALPKEAPACPVLAPPLAAEPVACEPKVITKTVVKATACAPQPSKPDLPVLCKIFGGY